MMQELQNTEGIRLEKPKNKTVREDLLVKKDRTRLLHAFGENIPVSVFTGTHLDAGKMSSSHDSN